MDDLRDDDECWDRSDDSRKRFIDTLLKPENRMKVARYARRVKDRKIIKIWYAAPGSFNIMAMVDMEDESIPRPVIRMPLIGPCAFPEEKTKYEAVMMRYLRSHLELSVPAVRYVADRCTDGPLSISPCIVIDWCEHYTTIARVLNGQEDVTKDPEDLIILKDYVSELRIEQMYRHIAEVLLQMWQPSFDQIGSLAEEKGKFVVKNRPLTQDMNEMVQLGNFPASELPQTTFQTSKAYFKALIDTQLALLKHQTRRTIDTANDWRTKYVARVLYKKLVVAGRFHFSESKEFKLFNDDLCTTNFLLDAEYNVAGIIDWEFTNALPQEFAASSPWWLLLRRPESYPGGYMHWVKAYEPRLKLFLQALRKEETKLGVFQHRLSDRMENNWESGDFWVMLAIRRSCCFDSIFWHYIAPDFYMSKDWRHLMHKHMTEEEQKVMEASIPKEFLGETTVEKVADEFKHQHLGKHTVS